MPFPSDLWLITLLPLMIAKYYDLLLCDAACMISGALIFVLSALFIRH